MVHTALHTLLISQIIGLYLVVMGLVLIARHDYYREIMTHMRTNSMAILLSGSSTLLLGIFLVAVHNIWMWRAELIVTVIAWLSVIKGLLWLLAPEKMIDATQHMYSGKKYYIAPVIMCLLGIVLIAHGYHLFVHPYFTTNV